MSVDMETTVKTWDDVPEDYKKPLHQLINEIQQALLSDFDIVNDDEDVDEENDNGYFPELDIEIHVESDPEASTRRLVVTSHPEDYTDKYQTRAK